MLPGVEFEFIRTTIGPGVDAGVLLPHAPGSREYLAVQAGVLALTLDGEQVRLRQRDSIFYAGDCHHGFALRACVVNPGTGPGDVDALLAEVRAALAGLLDRQPS